MLSHSQQLKVRSVLPYQWRLGNRNKRGLTLDLKSPGKQPVLENLVKWADVSIVNAPHPARKRLKPEYGDAVRA